MYEGCIIRNSHCNIVSTYNNTVTPHVINNGVHTIILRRSLPHVIIVIISQSLRATHTLAVINNTIHNKYADTPVTYGQSIIPSIHNNVANNTLPIFNNTAITEYHNTHTLIHYHTHTLITFVTIATHTHVSHHHEDTHTTHYNMSRAVRATIIIIVNNN